LIVGHHRKDDLAAARCGGRVTDDGAISREGCRPFAGSVEDSDVVSGFTEIAGHSLAHSPKTNESDVHRITCNI
jgi:hypothetical protein